MNEFNALASWYDRFSDKEVYPAYATYFRRVAQTYSAIPVNDVLDLGCGTGLLAAELSKEGYGVIGVDASVEMLAKARVNDPSMLLINRDITDFELYGTVQAVLCTLDTLNYLQSSKQLAGCFSLVANYLEPGGLFVFDVNTKYRFSVVYGNNDFVIEDKSDVFVWRNIDTRSSHTMMLSLFSRHSDGSYQRSDEQQQQKYFSPAIIQKTLVSSGFDIVAVYGSTDMSDVHETSEKLYYVARRNEKNANKPFAEE